MITFEAPLVAGSVVSVVRGNWVAEGYEHKLCFNK